MARKEIQEQIETVLELDGGWCRANQHIWRHIPPYRTEKKVMFVTFRCDHCTGMRHDQVSLQSGELLFRHYDMPKGYVLKKVGADRPTKSDWRKAHYAKLVKGGDK